MTTLRAELLEQKAQLLAYCASKLKSGDYHGVADAAMDLREIDAKLEVLDIVSTDTEREIYPHAV